MMMRTGFGLNAMISASVAVLGCGVALCADVIEIQQDGMSFIPNEVDAAPGDTLHFIWNDGGHTVTSGTKCTPGPIDGFSFDEALDDANQLVVITIPLTFSGDLGYLCDIYTHCETGNMHGVVHVVAAAPESPSAYTTEWRMDGMSGDDIASTLGLSTITPTGMVVDVEYYLTDTATEGLPSLSDGDTGVLVMNGGASPNTGLMTFLNVPANDGFSADIGEFTLIMDLYVPSGEGGTYIGMWNGNATNDNDADTFLKKTNMNFWSAGPGEVGAADSWAFDGWWRFAQRVDYSENTADIYVNGVHVAQTTAPDWWYNSVSGNPVWMLADNSGETQLLYCANMSIVDAYMSEADISALGGPRAAGIFSGNPVAGTGASYDAACNCTVRTAWESNSNGELYMGDDTTCGDTDCPLPSNNTCDGAIEIYEGITDFDSTDAGNSGFAYDFTICSGSSPGAMGKDVWFKFTAPMSGSVSITTCNTASYDTTIAMFDGACESLVMVGCNGDMPSDPNCQAYYSMIEVPVIIGTEYHLAIGGYSSGGAGPGTIDMAFAAAGPTGASFDPSCNCAERSQVESEYLGEVFMGEGTACADTACPLPSNNTCAGAIMITESVTPIDSTDASTSDFAYDFSSCTISYPGAMGKDVWYHFTPTEDGVATVTTCDGGSYDTTIAALEGDPCESLVMVACNGDASGDTGCQSYYSKVEIGVLAGVKYHVAVGGYSSSGGGPGTITITGVGIDDGSGGDCPGDTNGDGVIDGADLGALLAAWGGCAGCAADINEDGQVNGADMGLMLAAFGKCS